MNDIAKIMQAAHMAACWHADQQRKGEAAEPYINHLLEVAHLVSQVPEAPREWIIAALLHDAVEDQEVRPEEIERTFGPEVVRFVGEVTDDKSLPKQVRKRKQVETASLKSPGACAIKLADTTSNLRALVASPPPWSIARKREYLAWARSVVGGLSFKPAGLAAMFEEAARQLEDALEKEEAREISIGLADIGDEAP